MPQDDPRNQSVYHLFVAYVENRDAVRSASGTRGVQTGVHYRRPVHLQEAYSWLGHKQGSFPNTERACDRVLSLPLFPEMTNKQAEDVARTLADILRAK